MTSRCTVVVPCYNEAHRFSKEKFREFLAAASGVSFVFVDDGSQDGTLAVLEELRRGREEAVAILRQERNSGKGEAVRRGMLAALENPLTEVVGFWDADLATPLEAIFDLWQVLAEHPGVQMVFGARVNLLGRHIERRAVRHYLGRVFATVVSVLLRLPIYDTQCGAKLFRATPELRQMLRDPFGSKWVFDVELLARFIRLRQGRMEVVRGEIYEFPLHAWRDIAGSKVRAADFLRAFRDVVRIYRRYLS